MRVDLKARPHKVSTAATVAVICCSDDRLAVYSVVEVGRYRLCRYRYDIDISDPKYR